MRLVTVLGNTNSGAGAIYEYLIGRDDSLDPFEKREFRLLSDPGGINDLPIPPFLVSEWRLLGDIDHNDSN